MKKIIRLIKAEDGMMAISYLIIICVLSIISMYLCDMYQSQINSLAVLKAGETAKNFSLSRAEILISRYQKDLTLWEGDCAKAIFSYEFADAIIVDDVQEADENFQNKTAKAYLMHYKDNVYVLIVESTVNKIVNQVCIYLEQEDDELIVHRWER